MSFRGSSARCLTQAAGRLAAVEHADARCPVCGSTLIKPEDEVVWRCENASCPAKLKRSIEHFASRGAMNIEGSGGIARSISWSNGSWSRTWRTCTISMPQRSRISSAWGRSRRRICIEQIERSKTNDVWRLINGLGIRHVGERGAQVLVDHFGSVARAGRGIARRLAAGARSGPRARGVGSAVVR